MVAADHCGCLRGLLLLLLLSVAGFQVLAAEMTEAEKNARES